MGGNHQWEAQGRDDTTPTAKEAYRRDGPFLELKDFDVELDHLVSPRPYNLMIPYCPELELLNVPQILEHKGEERLAQFTVAHYPKLKRVSRCDPGFSDDNEEASESEFGNYDGAILNLTSKSMPKNTLESFCYDGYYESRNLHRARLFQSLKEVHLWNCRSLCGFSVTQLLHFPPVLESLTIENSSQDTQYNDMAATSLGGLIANIGKQKNLRVLILKVALLRLYVHQGLSPWTYRDEAFPGLLTQNSRAGNGFHDKGGLPKRGFLEMFGGLSKLVELQCSVSLNPRYSYGFSTRREEAEWMLAQWLEFKTAEFYPTKAESISLIADECLWLQETIVRSGVHRMS
ncbi:hypothetical protein BGZ97_002427 [Linnemannia gamsii]|uniref:Uncharacterized protein n=1 Tax=Linnemannia gamsii TaxID=64522 RepID=A0A9P6QX84_9FUNG|nr:hypothetical protein BGZ97_002427 [Linnemannia gamsii]